MSSSFVVIRTWSRIATLFVGAITVLMIVGPTVAHGGGTLQLSDALAGPYRLTVWSSPEPVRMGELHVTVGVGDTNGLSVLDASVLVIITPPNGSGKPFSDDATTSQSANKFNYEVDFVLTSPGIHEITVEVRGVEGEGIGRFDIEVLPLKVHEWNRVILIGGGVVASLTWIFWKKRANLHV